MWHGITLLSEMAGIHPGHDKFRGITSMSRRAPEPAAALDIAGRLARAIWSTIGRVRQELAVACGGARPYRPCRGRRGIRRAENRQAIFHVWSARSLAGRQNRSARLARRSAHHQALRTKQ